MSNTVQQSLEWAEQQLSSDSARLDAELLLAHLLDKNRTWLFTWPDKTLTDEQQQQFAALVAERSEGRPVAYILGQQEFWSLPFNVTPDTLIPRPETEQLVDYVLAHHDVSLPLDLIDAGTGTGAIAVALASEAPGWNITACDFSEGALQVARGNAKLNRVQVEFHQADWLSACEAESLDVIVSNPPYIREDDEHLADLECEPITALVAEDDGLADIRKLVAQAKTVLRPGGAIYIEHGYDQGEVVPAILKTVGFEQVGCEKDYAGNDRFSHGVLRAEEQ